MSAMSTSIDVAIRVRPIIELEKSRTLRNNPMRLDLERNEIRLLAEEKQNTKVFQFDKVCDEDCDQETFYKTTGIENYVDKVVDGYHATIFCYGQTGAGKTYTMEGVEYETPNVNRTNVTHKQNKIRGVKEEGIIPRAIRDIYRKTEILAKKHNRTYTICCSFLEIYNERIYDLLNPDQVSRMENNGPGLKLRWNKTDQFVVENLYVFTCNTNEEAMFLFNVGMKNKTMASHKLNNASSRSHAIFELKIEYYNNDSPEDIVTSKLDLVDLAGSERVSMVSHDGRVTKETIDINKSLFTLRQVINSITEGQNKPKEHIHIPYRDSKLTSLLKQSIGGNAYCLMIACLAPTDESFEENFSTLSYATKVTNIRNEPTKNDDPKMKAINNLKTENKDLMQKLNQANERILQLTEKMKGGLSRITSKAGSKRTEDFFVTDKNNDMQRDPSSQDMSQAEGGLKIKQNPSEFSSDVNLVINADTSNLTEELVEAINQIRYLLGQLKQEREKSEFASVQNEKQESLIAQLMRENQELRERVDSLEINSHNQGGTKSRSKSPVNPMRGDRRNSRDRQQTATYYGSMNPRNTEEQFRRPDRENMLMYTTMSTLHPDHEPIKGLVSPNADYSEKVMTFASGHHKRPTTNDGLSVGTPTSEMDNHFRTTTNFARNTIYRKATLTNSNLSHVPIDTDNFERNSTTTNTEGYQVREREMGMDLSNLHGKMSSGTPSHSRARNKSDMANYSSVEEAYQQSKLLKPKKESDRQRGSLERTYYQKPPSNIKAKNVQTPKLLLLKDVTHSITPIIQYPKTQSSKHRGLNNSFL